MEVGTHEAAYALLALGAQAQDIGRQVLQVALRDDDVGHGGVCRARPDGQRREGHARRVGDVAEAGRLGVRRARVAAAHVVALGARLLGVSLAVGDTAGLDRFRRDTPGRELAFRGLHLFGATRREAVDVGDDGVHLILGQGELRHQVVRGGDAARQGLTQRQARVAGAEGAERRRLGVRTVARRAHGVAADAVVRHDRAALADALLRLGDGRGGSAEAG